MNGIKDFHLIGIGGIGMSALASIALKQGHRVSGSDIKENQLTEKLRLEGAVIVSPHNEKAVKPDSIVVYSTAIQASNPEFALAKSLGLPLLHRSEFLNILMQDHKVLAVTGTHGKTTCSCLLAHVMLVADLSPSVAVGGQMGSQRENAWSGTGEYFVVEADESDGSFLRYSPFAAIVTNIEEDHLDYFGSMSVLTAAFAEFIRQIPSQENLFYCGDDPTLCSIAKEGVSYGFSSSCEWQVKDVQQQGWTQTFTIVHGAEVYRDIELALIGEHNALNALAIFALAIKLGLEEGVIRKAFASFSGIARRVERVETQSVTLINDYAHHPTELRVTVNSIRKAIGDKKLIAIFQPHRYTRTKDTLGMYENVFENADEVYISEIYPAGEQAIPGVDRGVLVDEINHENCFAIDHQNILNMLTERARPHDVILFMGAGDISGTFHRACDCLQINNYKVVVVCGGTATEHAVSLRSADYVSKALENGPYDVERIEIAPGGILEHSLRHADLCFPILHGPYGEDGAIQGYCETIGLPYVGCDYRSAALCMDKGRIKQVVQAMGVPTLPFYSYTAMDWKHHATEILHAVSNGLYFPVFVKPSHLGSSIAVQKVSSIEGLCLAIEYLLKYDTDFIIEQGIVNARELEFAIIGNETVIVPPPGEICSEGEVYTYEKKYSNDAMEVKAKALLTKEEEEKGCALAKQVYQLAGCSGFARIDFFLDTDGCWWFNEANPIPGLTSISLYPRIFASQGYSPQDIMDQWVILAMERYRRHQRIFRRSMSCSPNEAACVGV